MMLVLPLLILLLHHGGVHSCIQDSSNYSAFEISLLTNENLMKLQDAFFPTNKPASIVVDVFYQFVEPAESDHEDGKVKEIVFQQDHRILRDVNYINIESSNLQITMKLSSDGLASPINMFCRPQLLKELSLHTFQARISTVHLKLESPCEMDYLGATLLTGTDECTNVSDIYYLLNSLTSNVSIKYIIQLVG